MVWNEENCKNLRVNENVKNEIKMKTKEKWIEENIEMKKKEKSEKE